MQRISYWRYCYLCNRQRQMILWIMNCARFGKKRISIYTPHIDSSGILINLFELGYSGKVLGLMRTSGDEKRYLQIYQLLEQYSSEEGFEYQQHLDACEIALAEISSFSKIIGSSFFVQSRQANNLKQRNRLLINLRCSTWRLGSSRTA